MIGMTVLKDLAARDLHVHTRYCLHAEGTMEDYVCSALQKGLHEICFLAHAESGIDSPRRLWLTRDDLETYWEEGRELGHLYGDRIKVSVGLELGLNPDDVAGLCGIMRLHSWDRIGLSYHHVSHEDSRLNICSRRSKERLDLVDPLAMVMRYYTDLRDHLEIIRPHVLCHMDVVRKFMRDQSHHAQVRRCIREILEKMRRLGIALEVNTSGYESIGEPYPAPWIIKEAVELGIELSLSSDSHSPEHVARRYPDALSYIRFALNGGKETP